MKHFQFDPFTVLGGRENCTVGALRASATDVDVRLVSQSNSQARVDPVEMLSRLAGTSA